MPRLIRKNKSEFDQKLVDIARVARVVAGGRRFRFRASVVIGNRKGKVGVGIAKGTDVTQAVSKAVDRAKKNMILVPVVNDTIPHEVQIKFSGTEIFLKPARPGTGIIAGGAVRAVAELAGIKNILSKIRGSRNKANCIQATIEAFKEIRKSETIAQERGKTKDEIKKIKKPKTKEK